VISAQVRDTLGFFYLAGKYLGKFGLIELIEVTGVAWANLDKKM